MTTLHAESNHWLLWCDYCLSHFPPARNTGPDPWPAQIAASERSGWKHGKHESACPDCRSTAFLELPRQPAPDELRACTPDEVRRLDEENDW